MTNIVQPPDAHWIHVKSLHTEDEITDYFYTIDDGGKHICDDPVFLKHIRSSVIDCTWKWNGKRNWKIECKEYPLRFYMHEWASMEDFVRYGLIERKTNSKNDRVQKIVPDARQEFNKEGSQEKFCTVQIERVKNPPVFLVVAVTISKHVETPEYKKLHSLVSEYMDRCSGDVCDACWRPDMREKLSSELTDKIVGQVSDLQTFLDELLEYLADSTCDADDIYKRLKNWGEEYIKKLHSTKTESQS